MTDENRIDDYQLRDLEKVNQFLTQSTKEGVNSLLLHLPTILASSTDGSNYHKIFKIFLDSTDYNSIAKAIVAITLYSPAHSHMIFPDLMPLIKFEKKHPETTTSPQFPMGGILGLFEASNWLDDNWILETEYEKLFSRRIISFVKGNSKPLESVTEELLDNKYENQLAQAIAKFTKGNDRNRGKRYAHIVEIINAIYKHLENEHRLSPLQTLIADQIAFKLFADLSTRGRVHALSELYESILNFLE